MNIIGMDLGTSLVKIIECDEEGKLINKMILAEKDARKALKVFIDANDVDVNSVEKVILTGVGSSTINEEEICNIKLLKENEFLCIAKGGLELSSKKEAIIVSMGTGTAFVRVQGEDISHLGGTGVGGGTLINLCSKLIGTDSFDEIIKTAETGDLSKVDLRISDITTEEITTLPADITACNFGKLEKEAKNSDIALRNY